MLLFKSSIIQSKRNLLRKNYVYKTVWKRQYQHFVGSEHSLSFNIAFHFIFFSFFISYKNGSPSAKLIFKGPLK